VYNSRSYRRSYSHTCKYRFSATFYVVAYHFRQTDKLTTDQSCQLSGKAVSRRREPDGENFTKKFYESLLLRCG